MAARKGNRRTRKLRTSIWATVGGLGALSALGYWVEMRRETDLVDPNAGVTAEFLHEVPEEAPALAFRNVAEELGIDVRHGPGDRNRTLPEDTGSGLAWGDYDGDGDFDLYVVNYPVANATAPSGNRLFRNDGGRFADVTAEAGVEDAAGFGMGASFADYDGDGDADLYVTNFGANRLFRNFGDGRFEEVAAELGVDDDLWSIAAAWGDLDRDGRLDLYVTNYVEFGPETSGAVASDDASWQGVPYTLNPNAFDPQPNRLYRQRDDGRFEEVALVSGVSNPGGRSLAATLVDLDDDGWLDVYVANDVSPNALFHNLAGEMGGEAFFEDWSAATGTADPRGSMGISVIDFAGAQGEPDGLPELFITHWVAQENAFYQAIRTESGRLEYRDKIRELRMAEITTDKVGWGSGFLDLDLDGRADLAVANGSTLEENGSEPPRLLAQPLFLFWNDGQRFFDLAPAAGEALASDHVARGLALADFDLDGDCDIAVSVNRGRPLLLRNESVTSHRSIAVRLEGGRGGGAVEGTRLEVEAGSRRQARFWGADVSFASAHAAEWIAGTGLAAHAVLRVRRPGRAWLQVQGLSTGKRVVVR